MSNPNHAGGPPTTPPGWYPDGQGGQRWWDGSAWTEHTQPPVQQPVQQQPVQPQQPVGPTGPPPSSPPQQQWQQAPTGYPQQREGGLNGRLLGIIGGGAAAVIALVVVLVVVVGGGGAGPEGVVEDFLSAADDGDCDKLEDLVTEEFAASFGECDPAMFEEGPSGEDFSRDIGEADINDAEDEATVEVTLERDGENEKLTQTFTLVTEDDEWKIQSFS